MVPAASSQGSRDGEGFRFREDQRFTQWWLWALLIVLGVGLSLPWFLQTLFAVPLGNVPAPSGLLLLLAVFGVGLPVLFAYLRLRVTVFDDRLELNFRPIRRRTIRLADIARVEAVTYSPLLDYGGWGIKVGRKGWCYNTSGNHGVEVHLVDGRVVMVGSQRAEELESALRAAMATRSSAGATRA
jgi:hypothetical protein